MARTPLYDQLVSAGGRMTDFLGLEQPASFGDPRREYVELRSGSGVYDLGWRAKLVLTGADRTRWLNGMVTNNIRDLAPNHGNYSFLLNAQGRILGDLYAYNRSWTPRPGRRLRSRRRSTSSSSWTTSKSPVSARS